MFADRKFLFCVLLGLFAIGCSEATKSPDASKSTPDAVKVDTTVRAPAPIKTAFNSSKSNSKASSDVSFDIPRAYQTESLETLFSRVLSRGFRTRAKHTNLPRERCVKAMQAVVSRGHTSVSFLESKLNQGSLSEKALAMWSIGSMGPYAKKLGRDIAYGMSRSWTVPIKRCIKSGKEASECRTRVFGNIPSWFVKVGCRALANLDASRAVSDTATLGLTREMLVPCLPAFTNHIGDGTIRDRLIESWSLKAVQGRVLEFLNTQPKAALSFAVYWINSLRVQTEIDTCPLETVLGPLDGSIMQQLKGRLRSQELGALAEIRDSSQSSKARQCIIKYLDAFGVYDGALSPLPNKPASETPKPNQFFEVGEFCPADQ
jgi:hypothetical protein